MINVKYKKLFTNTAIFAVGQFASKLMVYFLMPLYTSILSPAESSVADFIQQTGNLLMPVACIGVCDGILRFAMDAGEKKKEYFSSAISVLIGGSAVFLLFTPVIQLADRAWNLFDGLDWLIPVFVITANLQMAVSYYIRSLGHTKTYAAQGIINTALTIIWNLVFLVWLRMGITGFILAIAVSNLIVSVVLIVYCKLWNDFSFRSVTKDSIKSLLKYSIPLIPTTLLWTVTSLTDRFLVRHYCGDMVNGLFCYAYKIPTVLTLMTTVFIEAWQLSAVNDSTDGDRGSFFTSVFKSYMGLIFMAASGLIAFTQVFTRLLMADSYFDSWKYMPVIAVATVFSAFSTFTATVYMVKKKTLKSFTTALVGALINIFLSWALVTVMGVQGVTLATVVSYLVLFLLRVKTAKNYIDFKIHPLILIANSLVISAQCAAMIFIDNFKWPVQTAFLLFFLIFNGRPIIAGLRLAIKKRKH